VRIGSRSTKKEYLASKPDEQSFRLSGVVATRLGDVLVASYMVKEKAIIDGQVYSTDPASRLTVFTRSEKTAPWQILSTANFNTIQCADTTGAGTPVTLAPSTTNASAADTARGTRLVNSWMTTLIGGDKARLAPLMSPAFQLKRNDGLRQSKADYLANPPKFTAFKLDGLVVGSTNDRMTLSYTATTDLTVNGQTVHTAPAPVLATFAKDTKTGTWQVVALAAMRAFVCQTGS
jgi:hypothetical protein